MTIPVSVDYHTKNLEPGHTLGQISKEITPTESKIDLIVEDRNKFLKALYHNS